MGNYSARQKKVKAEMIGAKEIVKALEDMEDKASGILSSAVLKGGDIALDDARKNCPVGDTGKLQDSLKVAEKKSSNIKAVASVDYDKSIKYGAFVELGTKKNPPNPFLRNAIDDNIDKINKVVAEEIRDAVVKEWK